MNLEEVVKELREIKNALKATEGKFIYTNGENVPALEEFLKKYPVTYKKSATLMADLYEFIVNANEDVWNEIRHRIISSGFKAYVSNTRLPVSGTIGTIQAVAEKAQVYGYNPDAGEWDWIKAVANKLAVYIDQIVKTSKSKKLIKVDITSDTELAPGAYEYFVITPPAGKVYRLVHLYFEAQAPSNATTGTHYVKIQNLGEPDWCSPTVSSNFDKVLQIIGSPTEYDAIKPLTVEAFAEFLSNVHGTHSYPIKFKYVNATDVTQTGDRILRAIFEELDEIS